jgi:preprotein translocase subunit SecD
VLGEKPTADMRLLPLIFLLLTTSAMAAEPVLKLAFSNEQLELGDSDLTQVSVQFDAQSGDPNVEFRISEEKAKLFEPMTGRHIGEAFDMNVCGTVVSSPRIMDTIRGQNMQVSGGFDLKGANALAEMLKTGSCR